MIDYLAIGHVCRDLLADGTTAIGGTVSFASAVAGALGCRSAVLTSTSAETDLHSALPHTRTHNIPAAHTTTFENVYTQHGRRQTLHARANTISAENLPQTWLAPTIAHLAPVAAELAANLADAFSPSTFVGLTAQGWLRNWDAKGNVYPIPLPAALLPVLQKIDAVVLSDEDLGEDVGGAALSRLRQHAKLLVLTRGNAGCTLYTANEAIHLPAPQVTQRNPTGAGDVFAATFFVRLAQKGVTPTQAAQFANNVAAQSVTRDTIEDKIALIQKFGTVTTPIID